MKKGNKKDFWRKILTFGTIGTILMLELPGTITAGSFTWNIKTVESAGSVGHFTLIALDTNGYPHISYHDDTNGDLKYAYKNAGGWTNVTVDSTDLVGIFTSLTLDINNYPHISYYADTNGDLKYAYKNAGGWTNVTVDSTGDVGQYTSLALDINGYPHISYTDYTNLDLKYAYKDAGGWHNETVDNTDMVGLFTSLALDTNGYPHISHYDYTNAALKYAYRNATGWHNETVDSTGIVGLYTSIALDTNGYPHISYHDSSNSDLKYAYKNATGWHNETVDSTGDVGHDTSLALDTNGYPHISYYDETNTALKYAYKDAGGWTNVTVDSTGDVGQYTSLALDINGYPHISYYDATNSDLKYVTPRYGVGYNWNYWTNPPHMYSIPSGNVGIGTSNPSARLHVKGDFRVEGNLTPRLFFVNASADALGIGTNILEPGFTVTIQGNASTNDKGMYVKTADNTYQSIVGQCHHQYRPAGFVLENRYPASRSFPKGVMMRFKGMDTDGVMQEYLAFITEYVTRTAGAIDGDCWIRPVKNNVANWAFRFTHDGKLLIKDGGVATDVPESALHVVGAINLDPITAPSAPTTGFIIYCDQADGDLKAKSDTGIVTTLATD